MEVHFEKMAERRFAPQTMATDESPAMLVICLIRSLKNWFGQSSRTQTDGSQLQFGYELLDLPVQEFAETFGPLIYEIQRVWPVQAFAARTNWSGCPFPTMANRLLSGSTVSLASGTMSSGTCIFAFSAWSLRQRSVCPGC